MNIEEYLTYHEIMRCKRDELQKECERLISVCSEKDNSIAGLNEKLRQIEKLKKSGKEHKNCQTNLDYKFFQNKKPDSHRGSGQMSAQRSLRSTQRGGLGGQGGKKPPTGQRRESRAENASINSKTNLQVDTNSSNNERSNVGQSPRVADSARRRQPISKKSGSNENMKSMNSSPSGKLNVQQSSKPEGESQEPVIRQMSQNKDSGNLSEKKGSINPPKHNQTIDQDSSKEKIISNTQSQQFKTVENTHMVLDDEIQT